MKKLALNIDDLRVDTFQTSAEPGSRGTVLGHNTMIGNTCAPSCPYTCGIVQQTADCRYGPGNTKDCPACV